MAALLGCPHLASSAVSATSTPRCCLGVGRVGTRPVQGAIVLGWIWQELACSRYNCCFPSRLLTRDGAGSNAAAAATFFNASLGHRTSCGAVLFFVTSTCAALTGHLEPGRQGCFLCSISRSGGCRKPGNTQAWSSVLWCFGHLDLD